MLVVSTLLTSCVGGVSGSATGSAVTPPADPPVASVSVTPQAATVLTGGTAQFAATVSNLAEASVQWEVNDVPGGDDTAGTIDSTGLYRAPASVPGGSVEITAVLQADAQQFGAANVTVIAPISISPRQAALTLSQTVQFQASRPSPGGTDVLWTTSGGTITADGVYTPAGSGVFTVTATSRTDPMDSAGASVYVTDFVGQSSWRNDPGLTGQNRQELALNPTTLAAGLFGKVSSCAVDGPVHTQPLYAANLSDGSRLRNLVYVATEHDSVYAFDADAIPCQQVWMKNFLDEANGVTAVPSDDIPGGNISAEVGIAGTPLIDRTTGTLYLIVRTKENSLFGITYAQRLHALDLATGSEKSGSPVLIAATAPGSGDGNNGSGTILFDPLVQSQRAALLLADGKLYVTFGGHEESSAFHGWLLVYEAATLAQVGVFNTTPNGSHGGFAENGAGVSADAQGNIFAAAGHGSFDDALSPPFRKDFGQTLLKLQPNTILTIADTFTPSNQRVLSDSQSDFASTGVVILPDQAGAAHPRLAVVGGTNGTLYLLDRDDLGGFTPTGPNRALKELNLAHAIYGTPAYWQNTLYVAASDDALKAYSLGGDTLADAPSSQSGALIGSPGASPTVSSNGESGAIVWVVDSSGSDSGAPAVLRAFDASDLARELYNSTQRPADAAGPAARLAVPTVANGRVYVGTQNELTVYGLLP